MTDVPVQLIDDARAGDRAAFDEIVRLTYVDTHALAYRMIGDSDEADDVVQEAYLRAYRGLQRFRGDARFTTWMHRITANCASTHLGRRRRHRHHELHDESPIADTDPSRDPVLRADATLLRDSVDDAVASLAPKLRAVVVLRDVYDLSHELIAAELGISETAAKVRLHRARRQLRARLFPPRRTRTQDTSSDEGHHDDARAV